MRLIKLFEEFGISDDGIYNWKEFKLEKIITINDSNGDVIGWCKFELRNDVFKNWNKISHDIYLDKVQDNTESLHIKGISVKQSGLGTKLIKDIEDKAIDLGIKFITLSAITSSIGFWKKLGYQIYSDGEFTYMFKVL
jgi:hypothetical protein